MSALRTLLDDFYDRAAARAERVFVIVRAVACTLAAIRMVVTNLEGIVAFEPRAWGYVFGIALIYVYMGVLWSAVRGGKASRPLLFASVVCDPILIGLALLPMVLWAPPFLHGFLYEPEAWLLLVSTFSVGVRLHPRVAAVGIAANGLVLGGLITIDRVLNGVQAFRGPADLAMVAIAFGCAAALAFVIVGWTRSLVRRAAIEAIRSQRATQALGSYVNTAVAEAALEVSELQPGGSRKLVAVLFADLRRFTRYAEERDPETVFAELNAYLEEMVAVVDANGGVVDKYIGDAIMVVFGHPVRTANPARQAIATAAAMRDALDAHNAARVGRGLVPLEQGIGVHYGPVVAGDLGTRRRLQHTVIGDTVNIAARLESATKDAGVPVLLSAALVEAAEDDRLVRCPSVALRGRGELDVYTLPEPVRESA